NVVRLRDVTVYSTELEADADGERPFLRRSECPVEISAAVTQAVMIMEAHERRDDSVGLDNFAMFGDGYVPEAPLDGVTHVPFPVFERRAFLHHHRQGEGSPTTAAHLVRKWAHVDFALYGPVDAENVEAKLFQQGAQVCEQG